MTITAVRAQAISIPVATPTRISTRVLGQREYLLVTVRDDNSECCGLGYAYIGTTGGAVARAAVDILLAPVLIGREADDISGLWERMYQETLLSGRRGLVVRAISAVDIGLWDLAAKRRGIPLCAMLGGTRRDIPVYASGGYYRPEDGPWAAAVAREIETNRGMGFVDHKIKVGGLSVPEDAERVAAAIDKLDVGGRLALDCNNAYRNTAEALRAIRAFEDAAGNHGLWWIEEPLSPDDVTGHASIAAEVETPIATGEIHQTRWEFRDLLDRRAADILQPDAGVVGGITEWLRVARTAETFGVPLAPHWHANLHVHLAAATLGCVTVEHFALEKDIYNFEEVVQVKSRLEVHNGYATVPTRPGLGIELEAERVKAYTTGDFTLDETA